MAKFKCTCTYCGAVFLDNLEKEVMCADCADAALIELDEYIDGMEY